MKRYTLILSPSKGLILDQDARPMAEVLLLRAHPRITYKLHNVRTVSDRDCIVELEVGTDRNSFRQALEEAGDDSPLILKDLQWGWESTLEEEFSTDQPMPVYNRDPLYEYPQVELVRIFPFKRKNILIRLLSFSVLTLFWIASLILKFIFRDLELMDAIYIPVFMVWLMQTNELPLHIHQFPVQIGCESDLNVYYWPSRRLNKVEWIDIWGLDYREPVCTLHTTQGKLRFILTDRISGNQKRSILQCIVQKACLRYVGGNLIGVMYRRPNAPDK